MVVTGGLLVDLAPARTSPPFRRLWLGQAVSAVGGHMTTVAVMFQVWRLTGSPAWTAAVAVARAGPLLVLGPIAGALLDRRERRRILLVATLGQAVCSAALWSQAALGARTVGWVLALVAVQSASGVAGGPAVRTFVAHLLPSTQVAAGLALQGIAMQASMLIGPALGGVVIGQVGVGGCYLVDVATFGLACYGVRGLPRVPPTAAPSGTGPGVVRDGFAFLLRHRAVRGALLTDLATTVLSFPISVFPLINAERFDDDPRTLGLFLTALAAGGVLASVLSGVFTRTARPGAVMLAASASWGVALTLFGALPNRWLALVMLVVAGGADTIAVVSRSTVIVTNTPPDLRGRVFTAEQMVGQGGPELGNLRAGLLASATSGLVSIVSGGLLCVGAVIAVGLTSPALRRAPMTPGVRQPLR